MRYLGHVMREVKKERQNFMREEVFKVLKIELFCRASKYVILDILRRTPIELL